MRKEPSLVRASETRVTGSWAAFAWSRPSCCLPRLCACRRPHARPSSTHSERSLGLAANRGSESGAASWAIACPMSPGGRAVLRGRFQTHLVMYHRRFVKAPEQSPIAGAFRPRRIASCCHGPRLSFNTCRVPQQSSFLRSEIVWLAGTTPFAEPCCAFKLFSVTFFGHHLLPLPSLKPPCGDKFLFLFLSLLHVQLSLSTFGCLRALAAAVFLELLLVRKAQQKGMNVMMYARIVRFRLHLFSESK